MHSFKLHAQEFLQIINLINQCCQHLKQMHFSKFYEKENIDEYLEIPHWL